MHTCTLFKKHFPLQQKRIRTKTFRIYLEHFPILFWVIIFNPAIAGTFDLVKCKRKTVVPN